MRETEVAHQSATAPVGSMSSLMALPSFLIGSSRGTLSPLVL
jgi:hypothetical protein